MGSEFTITFHRRPLARPVPWEHDAAGKPIRIESLWSKVHNRLVSNGVAHFWSRPSGTGAGIRSGSGGRLPCTVHGESASIRAFCKVGEGTWFAARNQPSDHFGKSRPGRSKSARPCHLSIPPAAPSSHRSPVAFDHRLLITGHRPPPPPARAPSCPGPGGPAARRPSGRP